MSPCPHCGADGAYEYASRPIFKCCACGKQFPATVGTIWRNTKLPLAKRREVENLLRSGVNAFQVHRQAGVSYPTAYKAAMRIRDAERA